MLSEKEKLEEELKLLKESFSLDVITREEYEEAKQRIESKLIELSQKENIIKNEQVVPKEPEKPHYAYEKHAQERTAPEAQSEAEKLIEEAEKGPIIKSAEETAEEEVAKALKFEKKEELAAVPEPAEQKEKIIFEEERRFEEEKGSKKIYVYAAIAVIFAIGLYFLFFEGKPDFNIMEANEGMGNGEMLISCYSDGDCKKDNMIGTCISPGEGSSECQYMEEPAIQLAILNTENCFNCGTDRIIKMLSSFFPNIDAKTIDFESEEGKNLSDKYDIKILPAYIFEPGIKDAHNYGKISSAFNEADDGFIMKNNVANSNYYIEREEIPDKLDLIVKPGQLASEEAEKNIQEFLQAFEGKVNFQKHNSDSTLSKALEINTFPVFLVNNKIKFNGVQPAEKIKENFCAMNDAAECDLELRESLI